MKSILDFNLKKKKHEKITMVTCYDFSLARILSSSKIDTILVGDSVAQIVHGYPNTLHATVDMMAMHTQAVAKGASEKFIVADMPFMSTRKGIKHAVNAAQKLMVAGAHAIKIENADGHAELITHLVQSGVPVMGHLGLTPQSIHQLGGPKIQGRQQEQAEKLINDAMILQQAGCFSLVLECIPSVLAEKVTKKLHIPTIGIGAGSHTDGQVLVINDLLGMNPDFNPKFLKKYFLAYPQILQAVNTYADEVKTHLFPLTEHSYD